MIDLDGYILLNGFNVFMIPGLEGNYDVLVFHNIKLLRSNPNAKLTSFTYYNN